MLRGVEKKRKEEEEFESTFTLRSQAAEVDDTGMLFVSLFFFIGFFRNGLD